MLSESGLKLVPVLPDGFHFLDDAFLDALHAPMFTFVCLSVGYLVHGEGLHLLDLLPDGEDEGLRHSLVEVVEVGKVWPCDPLVGRVGRGHVGG